MDCRLFLLLIYIKKGVVKGDRRLITDILNVRLRWKADVPIYLVFTSQGDKRYRQNISLFDLTISPFR